MRVVTFNILAPIFVRVPGAPHTDFPYCSEEQLDFEKRKLKIVQLIQSLSPDVVCLQEVQMEETGVPEAPFGVPKFLREALQGYQMLVPFGKTQTPKEWFETVERNNKTMQRPYVTHIATLYRTQSVEKL